MKSDVLVAGAGVVGLATALRLQDEGFNVLLADGSPPGRGASYGNAGTIADYAVMPVGHPGIFKQLPALLLSRSSPLSIQRSALLTLLPWLAKFLLESRAERFKANVAALVPLLADAADRWQTMASAANAASLLCHEGCLYLYPDLARFEQGKKDIRFRQKLGVTADMLTPDELLQLEPELRVEGGAAYFPESRFITDPGSMMDHLFNAFVSRGGTFAQQFVSSIHPDVRRTGATLANGERVSARFLVLCAGAYSRNLAKQVGDDVPLIAERGYHIEYSSLSGRLRRPACATEMGFYMCPMQGRVRIAGTVELGNTKPVISSARVKALEQGTRRYFPEAGEPDASWLGFRPSLPDSRPVISTSRRHKSVIYAFGHGHIGLTLAPVTAELVLSIVRNSNAPVSTAPYAVGRF